jgi:uncharacterized protein involved in copper resistance
MCGAFGFSGFGAPADVWARFVLSNQPDVSESFNIRPAKTALTVTRNSPNRGEHGRVRHPDHRAQPPHGGGASPDALHPQSGAGASLARPGNLRGAASEHAAAVPGRADEALGCLVLVNSARNDFAELLTLVRDIA